MPFSDIVQLSCRCRFDLSDFRFESDTPANIEHRPSPYLWIRYSVHGKEQRESTETADPKEADKLLKKRLDEVAADSLGARPFVGAVQYGTKVAKLLDALEEDYKLRGIRSLPQVRAHLKPIREAFGHWKAAAISPEAVDRYINRRLAEEKQAATINRETQILGQALRLAVARRQLSAVPPLRKLPEHNTRRGFLDRPEFETVVVELPEDLRDLARFAYLSAWRRGELVSLLWSDIDLPGRVVRLRPEESKNGEPRILPLEGELLEIIQRRETARIVTVDDQPRMVPLVFHRKGRPIVDFRKSWATACAAAGVAGTLFHDLRRSGVRPLVRAGVDPAIAMRISGHCTRSVFDRYNIVDERDLRAAVTKAETYLRAQTTERKVVPLRAAQGPDRNPDSRTLPAH